VLEERIRDARFPRSVESTTMPDLPRQYGRSTMRAIAGNARWRTALASIVVGTAGLTAIHAATDGFAAYTMESARRLQALRSPVAVPDGVLELADATHTSLQAIEAPVLLVDFVYTRCEGYCSVLGAVFTQLQQRLAAEAAAGKVKLVSISFDPQHDIPAALASYRDRHRGDPAAWILGRPQNAADLRRLLDAFGVVAIRDELGGYAHNAAVHVLSPERRLVAIYDPADTDGIVVGVRSMLEEKRNAGVR
jgi:protein SCO1/2